MWQEEGAAGSEGGRCRARPALSVEDEYAACPAETRRQTGLLRERSLARLLEGKAFH